MVNLLSALDERVYAALPKDLRIALNAPMTFDASIKQIIQLCRGRTLVIVPDEIRLDERQLWDFLGTHSVNVFDCTPTQWKILAAGGLPENLTVPFCVLFGGEIVGPELWFQLNDQQQRRPNLSFYNLYGPTEATVDASVTQIIDSVAVATVGDSLMNVQVHLLNDYLQPVASLVVGEVYIGGAGGSTRLPRSSRRHCVKLYPGSVQQQAGCTAISNRRSRASESGGGY